MTDPSLIASATVTVIGALTIAAVTVINTISKAKQEILRVAHENAKTASEAVAEVQKQVNGNLGEVKAELVAANLKIALLTERLMTRTAHQTGNGK